MATRLYLTGTEDTWMDSALKVAFASNDRETVNQHFGTAQGLVIFALTQDQYRLVETVRFDRQDMDGNEDKLLPKLNALQGCVAVYSQAAGASAIQQLQAQGVQALKVPAGSVIKDVLAELQNELRGTPSAWLARALIRHHRPANQTRFDDMEAEGWSE